MINPSDFIHPEDAAALRTLESIPGFPALVKKFLQIGLEQMQYGVNMASTIRLSPTQLPHLYNHLPPICKRLGIAEPEFYLEMNPMPNAWTFGDTKIYITITSGLVELLNDEELDAVIAHECGHILCRHVLYHSLAEYVLRGVDSLGLLGKLALPFEVALYYWYRKSELSCDRAAAIATSPETVASAMARLAGGPKEITSKINLKEWMKQADIYDQIYNDGVWNKTLQISVTMARSHPFSAVRVREVMKWGDTEQYKRIKNYLLSAPERVCTSCRRPVDSGWKFCKYCGHKL